MLINKKGFTLLELMVIIALFMVVMGAGLSLLITGNNSFSRSRISSNIHYEVRMVSDFIRNETRNATSIDLIAKPASFSADGFNYIIIDGTTIKHVDNGIVTNKTTFVMTEFTPMFSIELTSAHNNILAYEIEGSDTSSLGTKTFKVSTKTLLNNIRNKPSETGQAIRYIKP